MMPSLSSKTAIFQTTFLACQCCRKEALRAIDVCLSEIDITGASYVMLSNLLGKNLSLSLSLSFSMCTWQRIRHVFFVYTYQMSVHRISQSIDRGVCQRARRTSPTSAPISRRCAEISHQLVKSTTRYFSRVRSSLTSFNRIPFTRFPVITTRYRFPESSRSCCLHRRRASASFSEKLKNRADARFSRKVSQRDRSICRCSGTRWLRGTRIRRRFL